MSKRYLAAQLVRTLDVTLGEGRDAQVKLTSPDGMVGMMPVFETEEQCYEAYGDECAVMEIEVPDNKILVPNGGKYNV